MAAKFVLRSSASTLIAFALGTAALVPGSASAQERQDRGERGAGRMERSAPAMPTMQRPAERSAPMQAPAWQSRGPVSGSQPSWGGRPTYSQGSQMPQSSNSGGWNSRPAWQDRSQGDRGGFERGDRGNGANPAGQPAFGRPTWAQGSQTQQPGRPSWTHVDPNLGNPSRGNDGRGNDWRGNNGRPADNVDHSNDHSAPWSKDKQGSWYRDNGWQWRQDGRGQWYRDHDQNWGRNNQGQWYRNGWGSNTPRDWRRGGYNNGWGYNNGYNSGYYNGYNNGYSNGWRSWDRDGWRRDNRYDWYGWRNRHRSTFSLGFYYAPFSDYSYSRFGIGVVIGAPFYDERYWIADPWSYRLPPAYGSYRWVRYYDDALLVDIYTGEVVDAIYDIFY